MIKIQGLKSKFIANSLANDLTLNFTTILSSQEVKFFDKKNKVICNFTVDILKPNLFPLCLKN